MDKYGVIYSIKNKINNKIYFGQTTIGFDERYGNNLENNTHNEHLKRSIHKYRIENFEIDKEFDIANSQDELDKLEDMYIKIYNTTDRKFGYNKRGGGAGGKPNEETRKKLSISHKGEIPWNRKRVVCLNYKTTFNSVTEAGTYYNIDTSTIAKCCKGERIVCGVYLNNCIPLVWMYEEDYCTLNNDEIQNKIIKTIEKDKSNRKVICITTNKTFITAKLAGDYYDIDASGILKCCKGKYKYAGKLKDGTKLVWMYYKDYI